MENDPLGSSGTRSEVDRDVDRAWRVLDDPANEAFDHRAVDLDDLVGHEAV